MIELVSRVEWFILKLNPCFEHVVIFVNILQFYETTSIVPLKTWRKGGMKVGEGKILNYVTEPAPLVRRRKAPWPHAYEVEKEQYALQPLCQILDHLRLHIRWYNLKSRYQES